MVQYTEVQAESTNIKVSDDQTSYDWHALQGTKKITQGTGTVSYLCSLEPVHNNNCKDQTNCISQKSTLKILAAFSSRHIKPQCQSYKNA